MLLVEEAGNRPRCPPRHSIRRRSSAAVARIVSHGGVATAVAVHSTRCSPPGRQLSGRSDVNNDGAAVAATVAGAVARRSVVGSAALVMAPQTTERHQHDHRTLHVSPPRCEAKLGDVVGRNRTPRQPSGFPAVRDQERPHLLASTSRGSPVKLPLPDVAGGNRLRFTQIPQILIADHPQGNMKWENGGNTGALER